MLGIQPLRRLAELRIQQQDSRPMVSSLACEGAQVRDGLP